MSQKFSKIWKKRNSTNPDDQTALYLEIKQLFKIAAFRKDLTPDEQDDFFQDFYINKINNKLLTGHTISFPNYDNMSQNGIIRIMRLYYYSCYKKEKNRISTRYNNTDDINDLSIENNLPTDGLSLDLKKQFYPQDISDPEKQLSLDHMTTQAIQFIQSTDQWVQPLLLKFAKGEKFWGNDYPRRAKLGLTLKQSFHTGAVSIDDYHINTMIGRWAITIYDEKPPLSENFFREILKSLQKAALYIDNNEKQTKE